MLNEDYGIFIFFDVICKSSYVKKYDTNTLKIYIKFSYGNMLKINNVCSIFPQLKGHGNLKAAKIWN